jgi:hypothetical protein
MTDPQLHGIAKLGLGLGLGLRVRVRVSIAHRPSDLISNSPQRQPTCANDNHPAYGSSCGSSAGHYAPWTTQPCDQLDPEAQPAPEAQGLGSGGCEAGRHPGRARSPRGAATSRMQAAFFFTTERGQGGDGGRVVVCTAVRLAKSASG